MLLVQISKKYFLAESVIQDPVFPEKSRFINVKGIRESEFPNFRVDHMSIDKREVGLVFEGEMQPIAEEVTELLPPLPLVESAQIEVVQPIESLKKDKKKRASRQEV